ncbi:hypothetical protein Tco_0064359 [Tanacetum coccineum]
MDPVIRCTTLPSYSRSLKGFLFHFSRRSIQFYRLSHSELDDIEKVAVCSSLRPLKAKNALLIKILRVLRIILVVLPEHPSDTKVLTMKMEILLEPTSNKLLVGDRLKRILPDTGRSRIGGSSKKWRRENLVPVRVNSPPQCSLLSFKLNES